MAKGDPVKSSNIQGYGYVLTPRHPGYTYLFVLKIYEALVMRPSCARNLFGSTISAYGGPKHYPNTWAEEIA